MSEKPEPGPRRNEWSRLRSGLVVVLGGGALLAWFVVLMRMLTEPPPAELDATRRPWIVPRKAAAEPERYVGSAACRECHPGESAAFSRTGHAHTLRPTAKDPIALWLDGRTIEDPEKPGVMWSYHFRDRGLTVDRREDGKTSTFPIEFSFGSGHVGVTFVTTSQSGSDALPVGVEHRLSYVARGRKLVITPGQQRGAISEPGTRVVAYGRFMDEPRLLECFQCHATTTSRTGRERLDTSTMVPNVSCERCHGPGGDHVDAARRGAPAEALRMPLGPDDASPLTQITACGACHRSAGFTPRERLNPDDPGIVRFQPIGLAQSKCFQEGQGGLSCTSCHDLHARLSRDTVAYEAVCIGCHQATRETKKVCPVSPAKGCVECHMGRFAVTPEFQFTNHWIRVRSKEAMTPSPAG
jgi:hypothetical protein